MHTSSRTKTLRAQIVALTAAALLLPAVLAGCSSSPDGSASGAPSAGAGSADRAASKTAACMRAKGYDMADPSAGKFSVGRPDGVDPAQWDADFAACAGTGGHAAPGTATGDDSEFPDQDLVRRAKKVAACLREHGYEDFPDSLDAQATYQVPGDPDAFDEAGTACGRDFAPATRSGAGS
ncbi:hypothetical protein [Curtobacterium sp. VKM Ac-2922]|uniref:hypothetical protein n=1 Tax=Curtobacterium sp. VKM Ac-2922 TaxID=2929475 RepID=UPI001FB4B1D7|nr:hypothetical protein [Curtobacterium sp. VKM Ac-2922]MCJ1714099.1 hypothetical protein [Curtobacterium sp. VKM Ac-2922]